VPSTLTVVSWNMAYAYGIGSEGGSDYVPKDEAHFRQNLTRIAQVIRASEADLVFLQEIDFGAARSHRIDQLAELAALTGLGHYARARSWVANYIPFPFAPLGHHFGKMDSGGAVLSRWPITKNRVELLAKPTSKAWWYNLFYLYRYFQRVTIEVEDRHLKVLNLHLEAFDQQAREAQARRLVEVAKAEKVDLIAGDFNMLPAGALKRSGFGNPADVYESDLSYEILRQLPHQEIVNEVSYRANEGAWFTFPSNLPDRRLDYIYHLPKRALIRAEVIDSTHPEVSDHLPLKAVFKLFDPEFIRD